MSRKPNLRLIGFTTLFCSGAANAQHFELAWSATRNGPGPALTRDEAIDVALLPDGGVAVTGRSWGLDGEFDYLTLCYDEAGNELWSARFATEPGVIDEPWAVGADAAGNIYVTGQSYGGNPSTGGTDWDYVTIKYSPTGEELWNARYDAAGEWDIPYDLEVDAAGNVYIAGYSFVERTSRGVLATHFHLLKYDTSGNIVWQHHIDRDPHLGAGANDLLLAEDGSVYATGTQIRSDGGSIDDMLVVKIDPDGAIAYATAVDASVGDHGDRIFVDRDGNAYVAGGALEFASDWLVVKLDPAGNLMWTATSDFDGNERAYGVTVDDAGNVYAAMGLADLDGNDGMLVSYDADGNERWRRRYDKPLGFDDQYFRDVQMLPDGTLVVHAMSEDEAPDVYDFTLVRYSTDGELLGEDRFDLGSHSDVSFVMELDDRGGAALAGFSWSDTTGMDFATVRVTGPDAACPADLDGDGELSIFDFLAFQNLFDAGDPVADFDGDGDLTIFDFLAFQNAFDAGCP